MPHPENVEPHKWKKGQSGNPAGRKPGKNLRTVLKEMLEEEIDVTIEGQPGKVKKVFSEVILRRLIKAANDGEGWAIREIFDRVDGKAQQFIEMQLPGGMESLHKHEVIFKDMTKPVKSPKKKSTNKPTKNGRDQNKQEQAPGQD